MLRALDPFRFLLIAVAGWMNQHQLLVIDYLREENRILREQLGGRRLRFTDGQRRRLAAKAKGLGRKLLAEIATVAIGGISRVVCGGVVSRGALVASDASGRAVAATTGAEIAGRALAAGTVGALIPVLLKLSGRATAA